METSTDGRAALRQDTLSIQEFAAELRHGVGGNVVSAVEDPLGAALQHVARDPTQTSSQLLARMVTALSHDTGQFRRSEVFAFDRDTRALAVALVAAHAGMPAAAWARAVDASGIVQPFSGDA